MNAALPQPPVGPGGLRYGISQVSLVVRDIDALVRLYHETFGWAPWKVYDHVAPLHHGSVLRGEEVDYSLRGAEVQVGSLNFELLQPLDGPNIWREQLDSTGEGICSIATMFHTREDGDVVREHFREAFGIGDLMRAEIGDHIEYFYLDTTSRFGVPIESGSGHALDFVTPTYEYPDSDARWGESPLFHTRLPIAQVSVVVGDLEARMRAYSDAFGWGDWEIFGEGGAGSDGRVRSGETLVGDMNFELIEPGEADSPWREILQRRGEALASVGVRVADEAELRGIVDGFARRGVGVLAEGRSGNTSWVLLDSEETYKALIKLCTGTGIDSDAPRSAWR